MRELSPGKYTFACVGGCLFVVGWGVAVSVVVVWITQK